MAGAAHWQIIRRPVVELVGRRDAGADANMVGLWASRRRRRFAGIRGRGRVFTYEIGAAAKVANGSLEPSFTYFQKTIRHFMILNRNMPYCKKNKTFVALKSQFSNFSWSCYEWIQASSPARMLWYSYVAGHVFWILNFLQIHTYFHLSAVFHGS